LPGYRARTPTRTRPQRTRRPTRRARHPTDIPQCSGHDPSYSVRRNAAEQRAAAATGARYVSTVPWFCTTTCTAVIGSFQPYWDAYHMNSTFSLVLRQVLAGALDLHSYEAPTGAAAP
jgi:hypothetical protein